MVRTRRRRDGGLSVRPVRRGGLLLALAAAFAVMSLVGDEPYEARAMLKTAFVLAVVGLAMMTREPSPPAT